MPKQSKGKQAIGGWGSESTLAGNRGFVRGRVKGARHALRICWEKRLCATSIHNGKATVPRVSGKGSLVTVFHDTVPQPWTKSCAEMFSIHLTGTLCSKQSARRLVLCSATVSVNLLRTHAKSPQWMGYPQGSHCQRMNRRGIRNSQLQRAFAHIFCCNARCKRRGAPCVTRQAAVEQRRRGLTSAASGRKT